MAYQRGDISPTREGQQSIATRIQKKGAKRCRPNKRGRPCGRSRKTNVLAKRSKKTSSDHLARIVTSMCCEASYRLRRASHAQTKHQQNTKFAGKQKFSSAVESPPSSARRILRRSRSVALQRYVSYFHRDKPEETPPRFEQRNLRRHYFNPTRSL